MAASAVSSAATSSGSSVAAGPQLLPLLILVMIVLLGLTVAIAYLVQTFKFPFVHESLM